MPWMTANDEEATLFGEIKGLPDRPAGLMAAQVVDNRLLTAIKNCLVALDSETSKKLFRATGPIGSFSIRIDFGHALGIYGAKAKSDLVNIKEIRNWFAHRLPVKEFAHNDVVQRVENFFLYKEFEISSEPVAGGEAKTAMDVARHLLKGSVVPDLSSPRNIYMRTCEILILLLTHSLADPNRPLRPPTF